jgi:hypothetical protein
VDNLFKKMTATCDELAKLMADRGIVTPSAAIQARSGHRTARVTLNFAKATSSYPDKYEFISGDTIEEAVEKAEAWVMAQPTADERALQDALELTAKALEASREAGLDTGEGAAFVAQLEAMMRRLSENAITDQSEEVA